VASVQITTITVRSVPKHYTLAQLDQAADVLHHGGVLAYPTEAVFGLGCDPHDRIAFERIFTLKQRPSTQGVLLIAADFAQVERYVDMAHVPAGVLAQVRASWPGPFTWVFPRSAEVPDWVAGTHPGIALRVSNHTAAAALCRAFGGAQVSNNPQLGRRHGLFRGGARWRGRCPAWWGDPAIHHQGCVDRRYHPQLGDLVHST
jgi:L-threonylcarbamoyladenylate synthase